MATCRSLTVGEYDSGSSHQVDEGKNMCFFIHIHFHESFHFTKIVFVFSNGIVSSKIGFVLCTMNNLMTYGRSLEEKCRIKISKCITNCFFFIWSKCSVVISTNNRESISNTFTGPLRVFSPLFSHRDLFHLFHASVTLPTLEDLDESQQQKQSEFQYAECHGKGTEVVH